MKKRIICLILALALCLGLLPMTAGATDAAGEAAAQSVDALASAGHENHKYCGSTDCDHENEGSIDYAMPIDSEAALRNAVADGSYYLTDNIELSST